MYGICFILDGPEFERLKTPGSCSMVDGSSNCGSIVGFWSVGNVGICLNGDYGVAAGKNGFTGAIVEVSLHDRLKI